MWLETIRSILHTFYISVVRMINIYMDATRRLTLLIRNHTTLTVSMSNPSEAVTSSDNLLAYRPRFSDIHNSNLAAIFINLEDVFPCIQLLSGYLPICSTYTEEDDGFRGGRALLGSADMGNQFRIFSSSNDILSYGVAIQDCPELTNECFPSYHSFTIVCYLPRAACS